MSSKYNVGDLVEFAGQKAIIKAVHEEDYFFGHNHLYYTYDLEYTDDSGGQKGVTEAALTLLMGSSNAKINEKRICECGAWAIHWAAEEHARYCPAYSLFNYKERK